MILEVHEEHEPAVFWQGLFTTEILSMSSAGGRPKPKHFKCVMHYALLVAGDKVAGGGESCEADPPVPAVAETSDPAPAAAVADAEAAVAAAAAESPSKPAPVSSRRE